MTGPRVLVVDDEAAYREALEAGLSQEGYDVVVAEDGRRAVRRFEEERPRLVLLDLVLPDGPGTEVCQRMLELAPIPIIIVTARGAEADVVLGLELGASDYVVKPFRLRELLARVRALLRWGEPRRPRAPTPICAGRVQVDVMARLVTVAGRSSDLSRREFDLLALLASRPGELVTRAECLDLVWATPITDVRTLDTHVWRLRRKIEVDPAKPRHLRTVRGNGYRFEP